MAGESGIAGTASPLQTQGPAAQWWGCVPYNQALDNMTRAHADRVAGLIPDSFFYLEHEKVITYGRATPASEINLAGPDIPRIEVPRGGLATYHAPGQLVGYIIMDLARRSNGQSPDIHAYLHAIEQGLIAFLKAEFDLPAGRRDGFTGVWTLPDSTSPNGRKLASIGVNARKWVTTHGFALNIHPDMSGFNAIVPCGITDASMTSVLDEAQKVGRPFKSRPMDEWASAAHCHLLDALKQAGWLP